jgi:hypothetical protein
VLQTIFEITTLTLECGGWVSSLSGKVECDARGGRSREKN